MLKDNEKGAVLQADRETYAIAPHVPCGIATPEMLRKIADVAEKYGKQMKITSSYRIAIFGISEKDVGKAWQELGMAPGAMAGLCVRSVRCCPGDTWCRLGQRDSMGLAGRLDRRWHGVELVNKLKIAVSGCPVDCAEAKLRDVGLIAQGKRKWVLYAGGNVGARPRFALKVAEGLDDDNAMAGVEAAIGYFTDNAKKGERLGKTVERLGTEPLAAWIEKRLNEGG